MVTESRAAAGVGNPINESVCVEFKLNLASLKAAKIGIAAGL